MAQLGPKDIDPETRMAVLVAATGEGQRLASGEHETEKGVDQRVDPALVDGIVAGWPEAARMGVQAMVKQYGPPNEATPTKLMWYRNDPWKRTVLTSDEVLHKFPSPHADFLTQWIDYKVPVDKFAVIGAYDGSCLVDRTTGEAGARCDSEAANMLTLNLMHDLVTGKTDVSTARAFYAETLAAYALGRPAPYCEAFQFDLPTSGTEDPDEPETDGPVMKEVVAKVTTQLGVSGMARTAVAKVKDVLSSDG